MERDQRQTSSTMGNLSLGVGVLVIILFVVGMGGLVVAPSGTDAPPDTPIYGIAENYVMLLCIGLPLSVFGTITGLIGLFNPEKSRIFAILGFLISISYLAGVFLIIGGSLLFAALTGMV